MREIGESTSVRSYLRMAKILVPFKSRSSTSGTVSPQFAASLRHVTSFSAIRCSRSGFKIHVDGAPLVGLVHCPSDKRPRTIFPWYPGKDGVHPRPRSAPKGVVGRASIRAMRSCVDTFSLPQSELSSGISPSGSKTTAPAHSEPNVVRSPNVSSGDTPANCAIAIKTGPSGRRFEKKSSARSSRELVGDPRGSETDKTRLPRPHRSMPCCSQSKTMRLLSADVSDRTGVPYSHATRRSTIRGRSSNYHFAAKQSKQSKRVVQRGTELPRFEV